MDGGAGPSGVDATGRRRLCTAFKKSSADLCDAIALLARRLSTSYLDPSGIQAFVSWSASNWVWGGVASYCW